MPHPKLARLHPAQLADLVEAASHGEGEEIMDAVGGDRELEADVFEELDDEHQREFLDERDDAEVAEMLARMEPDDAADLVAELPRSAGSRFSPSCPACSGAKVRALLGYDPATAGGLMSPDFVACTGRRRSTRRSSAAEQPAPADADGRLRDGHARAA